MKEKPSKEEVQSLQSKISDSLKGTSDSYCEQDGNTLRSVIQASKRQTRLNSLKKIPKIDDKVIVKTVKGELKGVVIRKKKDSFYVAPSSKNCEEFYTVKTETSIVKYEIDNFYYTTRFGALKEEMIEHLQCTPNKNGTEYTSKYREYIPYKVEDLRIDNSAWISDMLTNNTLTVLPIFINSEVFNSILIPLINEDWVPHTENLKNEIFETMDDIIERSLNDCIPANVQQFSLWIRSNLDEVISKLKCIPKGNDSYSQNHYLFEIMNKSRNEGIINSLKKIAKNDVTSSSLGYYRSE